MATPRELLSALPHGLSGGMVGAVVGVALLPLTYGATLHLLPAADRVAPVSASGPLVTRPPQARRATAPVAVVPSVVASVVASAVASAAPSAARPTAHTAAARSHAAAGTAPTAPPRPQRRTAPRAEPLKLPDVPELSEPSESSGHGQGDGSDD